MSLSRTSIQKPISTFMIFLAVLVLGAVSLTRIAVDLLPDITFPIVAVYTDYKGAGPAEVERMITEPIEKTVGTVNNVKEVGSYSNEGTSLVIIEFNWGTNMDLAANDVRESLSFISDIMPEDANEPMVIKFDPSMMPIMMLRVSGDIDPARLKQITDDDIIYKIEQVEGVAAAYSEGGVEREIQVELDRAKLQATGISPDQIKGVLAMENLNLPGGYVKRGNKEFILRTVGEFRDIAQIENVILTSRGGVPVYLKDVARVKDGFKEKRGEVWVKGNPVIAVIIQKQSGKNTVQIARKIRRQIGKIQGSLPEGTHIKILFDTSEFIVRSIKQVAQVATVGGFLAILVLWVFLRNIPSTLVISLAIPISIIGTFVLLDFSHLSLNMMTLGGLSLGVGMLVDNSIVVLENIFRHREKGEGGMDAANNGTDEVNMAIATSTLTTICVFLPLFFVSGIAGMFFKNMAYTVTFSLVVSLLVALTLIPMLCSKFLRLPDTKGRFFVKTGKMLEEMDKGYGKVVEWALTHRKKVVLGTAALFIASLLLFPFAGMEFMPETDEGEINATVKLPVGTKLEVTTEACRKVEKIFNENVPEIDTIFVRAGQGGVFQSFFGGGSGSHRGTVRVNLVKQNRRKRSTKEIVESLRPLLMRTIPDTEVLFNTEMGAHFMGMGGGSPITINVKGYDLAQGAALGKRIVDAVRETKGTREARVDREEGLPEYRFVIDREKASSLGLSGTQIANTIKTNVEGSVATWFREGGHEYDIIVRLREQDRMRLDDVMNIVITSMTGKQIPLKAVAGIETVEGPVSIRREGQQRTISVLAGLSGRDLASTVREIKSKIRKIVIPGGFSVEFSGQQEEMVNSFRDLALAFLLAALLVYMVMASQFESLLDPFIIMFSVPLCIIGVIWMLFLTGTMFNVIVFIGLIMLAGIVVNNGIVLISYINILRKRGMPLKEAIMEGGRTRLRPILMTTLTTILGLIPMASGLGEGSELTAPLARTVIGGLLVSTIFTLVFIPTLYDIFEEFVRGKRFFRRITGNNG